jgi:hypothetical protein
MGTTLSPFKPIVIIGKSNFEQSSPYSSEITVQDAITTTPNGVTIATHNH